MKYYSYELQDGFENVSLEKTLLDKNEPFYMFATVKDTVFIGVDVSSSVYRPNTHGVPLVRYNGTGGPVFFNEGNIKTSLLVNNIDDPINTCISWIIQSLQDVGITDLTTEGNDIFIKGKKVCGIGTKEFGDKIFLPFFFSINIDFDKARDTMILTKHTRNLEERADGINAITGLNITSYDIEDALKKRFLEYWEENLEESNDFQMNDYNNNLINIADNKWIIIGNKE